MLECRVALFYQDGKELDVLEQIAKEQLKSCQQHPIPRPSTSDSPDQFVFWNAFDAVLRADVRPLPR